MHNQIIVYNENDSQILARHIASNIRSGDILIFEGEIGAGKSFFCRKIIQYLCGNEIRVISPTFNLLQTYQCKTFMIYHYDLYRIQCPSELYELGFEDALSNNIVLIEWPNVALSLLPINDITTVKIKIIDETSRYVTYTIKK